MTPHRQLSNGEPFEQGSASDRHASVEGSESEMTSFGKMSSLTQIPQQTHKNISIPAHLGYRVGPKGGYILWDKRISNGNDGQEWYASYREKKKYNLLKP